MSSAPRLRADLVLVEQTYRGEQSYIVKDPKSRKYFRFRPVEMQRHAGARRRTERRRRGRGAGRGGTPRVGGGGGEVRRQAQGAWGCSSAPSASARCCMMERLRAQRRRRLAAAGSSRATSSGSAGPWATPTSSWTARCPTCGAASPARSSSARSSLFAIYLLILALKWPRLHHGVRRSLPLPATRAGSWSVFWLTGTAIIVIHELGHGYTCKYFGGQVHEIGAMLLYFEPAFFCNVNDAWTFPDLKARLWVTAAGSWIQLVARQPRGHRLVGRDAGHAGLRRSRSARCSSAE